MMGNGNAEQCLFITVCVYFMSNLFFPYEVSYLHQSIKLITPRTLISSNESDIRKTG